MKRRMKITVMVTAVLFAMSSPANAEIVSNSNIVDDIEYYMQTDDSVYNLGEDIEMLFRVTNLREEDVTISCSRLPEFDFWVLQNEQIVWSLIDWFQWYSPSVEILSGQSEDLIYTWDMIGNDENPVDIGTYNVVGLMYNEPWNDFYYGNYVPSEVAVEITIVPEPATILLFATGAIAIRMRRRGS